MNKKAFLRIIEVMFSITIIATAIMYAYLNSDMIIRDSFEDYVSNFQKEILFEIAYDNTLRNHALKNNESALKQNINLPSNLEYDIKICEFSPNIACELDNTLELQILDKEKYVDETIITSNLTTYSPKRVKLFIWEA